MPVVGSWVGRSRVCPGLARPAGGGIIPGVTAHAQPGDGLPAAASTAGRTLDRLPLDRLPLDRLPLDQCQNNHRGCCPPSSRPLKGRLSLGEISKV